jgi:hypothetical protein
MAEKCLHSQCAATTDHEQDDPVVTNLEKSLVADSDQLTDQIAISDQVSAVYDRPAEDVGSASQQANMSAVHLQDILAIVQQPIQDEISKQTELQTPALNSKLY